MRELPGRDGAVGRQARTFTAPLSKIEAAEKAAQPATTRDDADDMLAEMFGVSVRMRFPIHPWTRASPTPSNDCAKRRKRTTASMRSVESVHLSPRFAHVFKGRNRRAGAPLPVVAQDAQGPRRRHRGHSLTTAALSAGFPILHICREPCAQ